MMFIVLARKPITNSITENVCQYGTGVLNIEDCRIGCAPDDISPVKDGEVHNPRRSSIWCNDDGSFDLPRNFQPHLLGRFPANILLFHTINCKKIGKKKVKSDCHYPKERTAITEKGKFLYGHAGQEGLDEKIIKQEEVDEWECSEDCVVKKMDEQSGIRQAGKSNNNALKGESGKTTPLRRGTLISRDDIGGASRFFKVFSPEDKQKEV